MKKRFLNAVPCVVSVLLTGAIAVTTVDKLLIEPQTVSSWSELYDCYLVSRTSLPPLPSPVPYEEVFQKMSVADWSFLADHWQYTQTDGPYYIAKDSKLAELKLPLHIRVYEDLQRGEVVILSSTDGEKYQGEALFKAPEFLPYEKDFPLETYLSDELSPRRVVWEITLKSEADAWIDLVLQREEAATSELLEGGGMMRSMMVPAEHANELWLCLEPQTNGGMNLNVFAPEGFTNRVEIYSCTNLISNGSTGSPQVVWNIAAQNLYPSGTNPAVWNVPTTGHRFFVAGNMDIDSDGDGLPDAREKYVYKTNSNNPDTDGDGMPDRWEIENGLDPKTNSDQMADPDHDMLPNVYEYFRGTNPQTNDSYLITKIRVDPANAASSNTYASIKAAMAASVAYSVIEVAEGTYSGPTNTGVFFPEHPVMLMSDNWGTSHTTVVKYDRDFYDHIPAAFILDKAQDNRTIIRGLTLEMEGDKRYQVGFWVGNGAFAGPGAAPFFDGVTVELGTSDVNIGYFCRHAHPGTVIFNNCVFRGKQGSEVPLRGIYAVDSPSIKIINCTFQNFPSQPYSYGVQLESTAGNNGKAFNPVSVEIANSVWDESFAASNTECFVRRECGVEYDVHVSNSIMPAYPDWFPPNYSINLHVADALLSAGAHQTTNSPGINSAGAPLTWYDFEGQARGFAPDIGADEYGNYSAGDSDHDGLSDLEEATIYFTDMYVADTDGDSIPDGIEVADGTSPTNAFNYRVTIQGAVTNLYGTSAPVYVCCSETNGVWNSAVSTNVDLNGNFTFENYVANSVSGVWIQVYCDFNTNGVRDTDETVYSRALMPTGSLYPCYFEIWDCDKDGVDDRSECACGTDPYDSANYCVTFSGMVSSYTTFSNALGVSLATGPLGQNVLITTNVTATNSFRFDHVEVTESGPLWVHLFNDINTNAVHDPDELSVAKMTFVTGAVTEVHMELSLNTCDQDKDLILDFWEQRNGLDWTDKTDAFADFDGDWIDNLWEYRLSFDPHSYNTNNYAFADAMRAVDTRIAGKNPTNSIKIYSTQNHSAGIYERNTNCWAADIDLTICSPWNNYDANKRAGTLISPRHALFVNHLPDSPFFVPAGYQLRFVDATNGVYMATIESVTHLPTTNGADLTVAVLTGNVPTNRFSFAKILPGDYTNYIGRTDIHVPGLCLDQEEKALVHDLSTYNTFSMPVYGDRVNYSDGPGGLIGGDSGNPGFIILNNQPVLTTLWVHGVGGNGTPVTMFKDEINAIMSQNGDYSLTEMDLSGYVEIPENLR